MCVLSSTWRQACVFHPNLYFGIQTVLGSRANAELIFTDPRKRMLTTNKFIERVDAILKNHCTTQVNKFAIEFGLSTEHASHINRWVSFAIASKARVVVLDLSPNKSALDRDNYDFPFQLFDGHSGSHLQALQLHWVTLGPRPDFCGFANLKMLELVFLIVSQDLQHLLSKCCVLEWLRIRLCFFQLPSLSFLCVQEPLYRLQYLCIEDSAFREIEFHAPNLMTFEYKGSRTLINLNECLKLKTATIRLYLNDTLEYVLTWIPCILPQVDTLCVKLRISSKVCFCPLSTFCTICFPISYLVASLPLNLFQMSGFTQPPLKFIQLRHLTMEITSCCDPNSVFQLAYLLEAAPLLEDLHFDVSTCFVCLRLSVVTHVCHFIVTELMSYSSTLFILPYRCFVCSICSRNPYRVIFQTTSNFSLYQL